MSPAARAYENVAAYRRAMALLAKARVEVEAEPEHEWEADADGSHPLDDISNAEAAVLRRIDALQMRLAPIERKAA